MTKATLLFISISLIIAFYGYPLKRENIFRNLKGPYMGKTAQVQKADVFLDGIISKMNTPEMCAAFTKDGKEFYYNALYNGEWSIFVSRDSGQGWTKPVPMSFTSGFVDRDFTISPDGNKIYFGSNRPRNRSGNIQKRLDIFVTKRLNNGKWSEPEAIGTPINTSFGENYPSIASNGNMYYFSCRKSGMGGCDIYMSKFINGKYTEPIILSNAVNSEKHDWDAFIAPDESYIIFSSKDRPNSIGGQDLYISYKKSNGSWSKSKNMGPAVNSESGEICPSVSLDGKYFFFTSRRRGKADIFWMTSDIIRKLKQ